jgi:hypothetical protein
MVPNHQSDSSIETYVETYGIGIILIIHLKRTPRW